MSRTDILTEIKKAEADAEAMVKQAEADKKAAIADARRESVKKIQDAEAQMRSSNESAIAQVKSELDMKREAVLNEGRQTANGISSRADAKVKEVKDFLNKEFERTLNVTS